MTTASINRRVVRLEQNNPEPGGIAHLSYEENHEGVPYAVSANRRQGHRRRQRAN
jgi:hypothetical protein